VLFVDSTNGEQLPGDLRRRLVATCEQVTADAPALVEQVVATIRAEIPDYSLVPVGEHRRWVDEHVRLLLAGIAEQRPPQPEQVRHARELGGLRARQGLAIELLLGAYHITYRETWNAVLRQAAAADPELAGRLAYVVNLFFSWVRIMTSAASDAYSEELRRSQVLQANLRFRFLDALAADPGSDLAAGLATSLGYRTGGRFQALCLPSEDWPADRVERLQRRLAVLPGNLLCTARGADVVVLGQHSDAEAVLDVVRRVGDEPVRAGVGLRRSGMSGAATSISDAEAALDWARSRRTTVSYEQDWLVIGLAREAARLEPLFAEAVRTAASDPHLAETVRAFARGGLSIADAARELHLHPNSVAYRLQRWHERTGWNPRTGDGLLASLVALRLYPH